MASGPRAWGGGCDHERVGARAGAGVPAFERPGGVGHLCPAPWSKSLARLVARCMRHSSPRRILEARLDFPLLRLASSTVAQIETDAAMAKRMKWMAAASVSSETTCLITQLWAVKTRSL